MYQYWDTPGGEELPNARSPLRFALYDKVAPEALHICERRKLSDQTWQGSPGKKKSLMDIGLVSEFYLTYTTAKYLREGTIDGTPQLPIC